MINIIPYVGYYDFVKAYDINVDDNIKNIKLYYSHYYSDNIIFSMNSLKSPHSLYNMNLETKEKTFLRSKPVPNYNSELYHTERIYAPSHDGIMVPMSVVYRKDKFKNDGTNPLYLYGYGSYGSTIDPNFKSTIIPLLDRGFVYVIGHVRGGSFLGEKWYEDGKMETKINTFLDFNACAEYLIKEKYTFDKGITIEGRSAGGLLVGACMTMRPELYRTVIAGVPFVDVMNTMADPSIPLTVPEWEQWGNPNVKKYFDIMLKYSPYDNIKELEYPNLLALAGLNDPRVAYWEPAKFVAKLRYYDTGKNVMLLKTEMEQGHFGGMDRYKHIRETAFTYSFVLSTYK
jgi:oligopeptidase B